MSKGTNHGAVRKSHLRASNTINENSDIRAAICNST